jgi:hypothetical protein
VAQTVATASAVKKTQTAANRAALRANVIVPPSSAGGVS